MLTVLLLVGAASVFMASCGDDDPVPGGGGEDNTTDVAVTGTVEELGSTYAQISGVVNLNVISASYSSVKVGVEVSTEQDFVDKTRYIADGVIVREFSVRLTSLNPETKYYYRTFVSVSTLSFDYYGTIQTFTTEEQSGPSTGEYVDLGLPSGTLWATHNIGATNPEDYGDYFAWGETTPKSTYSWSTYKYYDGSSNTSNKLTKYCTSSGYGTVDNKKELDLSDDAAYVNWGNQWRMPSLDQLTELCTECTWTWTQLNGVNGYEVVGSNGNSVFLPATGCRYAAALLNAGSGGYFWSRSLYTSDSSYGRGLYFHSGGVYTGYYDNRYYGRSVRPVRLSN